jgi:CubicO group peptidase (beta-lactamase class C family)
MYITAAHIIATYSGVPFATFVEERIFRLLNMTQSTYNARRADESGKFAQVFSGIDGRRIPWWFDRSGGSVLDGAGGIISSAPDLIKWTRFLLGEGNSAVSETILDTMKPQSLMDPNTDGGRGIMTYGFGWGQTIFKNGRRV